MPLSSYSHSTSRASVGVKMVISLTMAVPNSLVGLGSASHRQSVMDTQPSLMDGEFTALKMCVPCSLTVSCLDWTDLLNSPLWANSYDPKDLSCDHVRLTRLLGDVSKLSSTGGLRPVDLHSLPYLVGLRSAEQSALYKTFQCMAAYGPFWM